MTNYMQSRLHLCDLTAYEAVKRALLLVEDAQIQKHYYEWENALCGNISPYTLVTGVVNDPMYELSKATF